MAERRRGVQRLAVLQELRASYGIKVKGGSCPPAARTHGATAAEGRIFGVSFHALPQSLVPGYGYIPSFLVDACEYLEEHIHTEGLFRKSGSLVRIKALKSKLDQGENCLSAALPCDVAGLLKQFFRELPEPILPPHLQEGLFKAQQLGNEKKTATMLLSCLMTDGTIEALRFFFKFLRNVSLRSNENKMDSSNLAVIFAPNLLHVNESEKMSTTTEKKIRLQAAVVQTFIDHAEEIGQVPEFILEKIPAMLGVDAFQSTPSLRGHEDSENESPSECKRRKHRSVGDIVSGALNKFKSNRTPSTTPQQDRSVLSSVTPVVLTPSTKRKLPADCSQGLSSKKRRSFKPNFAFELLPSSIFNSSLTPASVHFEASPSVSLESSQTSLSPSTGGENHLSSAGNRRSKRLANKKLYRAESGKTGCFSPKISRKEMVRRSLRLKFGLGKSNRDNIVSGCAVGNRSENIGRRLASQQGLESTDECAKRDVLFSPYISEKVCRKGSKNVSKSEENLLTPKCNDKVVYRMSWNSPTVTDSQEISCNEGILPGHAETGNSSSEPAFIFGKPPVVPDERKPTAVDKQDNRLKLCEEESNLTAETLLKVKQAFSESGSNLQSLIVDTKSSFTNVPGETLHETLCLTGLSPEKELAAELSGNESSVQNSPAKNGINKLDSFERKEEIELTHSQTSENHVLKCCNLEENTAELSWVRTASCFAVLKTLIKLQLKHHLFLTMEKVSDHIQWFNKLSLNDSSSASKTKPPLKFQRTPVRQSVRRINSLLEANRRSVSSQMVRGNDVGSPLVKSLSCDSALSYCAEKLSKNSTAFSLRSESTYDQASASHSQLDFTSKSCHRCLNPSDKPDLSVRTTGIYEQKETVLPSKSVLEDLTNHETVKSSLKVNADVNVPGFAPEKTTVARSAPGKEKLRYRGSPKNPISKVKLLPTAKPVDL
uniref:Rho-GAP domain-containing protein n=1 Tax=Anas platyrhynchos TaxID=8839 RepID=A0A8B9TSH4_ANAPL